MKQFAKLYVGIYSSDNIPIFRLPNFTLVSNLSEFGKKGSHFICIHKTPTKIFYFDPSGEKCVSWNLLAYLQLYNLPIVELAYKLQNTFSYFCGFYCIAFCLSREINMRHKTFFSLFSNNLLLNEKICIMFIQEYIRQIKSY